MALELVEAPDPIQQYPSGMIAIRCADYMGAARGSLTTTADALSVAGTVVKDTQTIAVATTNVSEATRYGLASDTLVIPWADITAFYDSTNADGVWVMLGLRVAGDAPSTAQKNSTFYTFAANGLSAAVGWARGTTYFFGSDIWKSVWGNQYRITAPIQWDEGSFTGTNLVARAWGLTGGSLEFYLDVVYVMPYSFSGTTKWWDWYYGSDWPPLSLDTNGTIFQGRDVDVIDTDNVIGKFSVRFFGSGYTSSGNAGQATTPSDYQEDNDEDEVFDATNGLWDGSNMGLTDPPSWLVFEACPLYLEAQSVISDSFNNNHPSDGNTNQVVSTPDLFGKTLFVGSFSVPVLGYPKGWSENTGAANCLIPIGQTVEQAASMIFGNASFLTGSGTTPDLALPRLDDFEDFTQTFSFDVDSLTDMAFFSEQFDTTVGASAVQHGALVTISSGGSLDLTLESNSELSYWASNPRLTFGGPVNITGSFTPGDVYWLKVERRSYFWRAKCWADGGTEPDWQVSGYQGLPATDNANGNPDWVEYPYDTNWVGDSNHDRYDDYPLDWRGFPGITVRAYGGNAADVNARVYQYDLTVDPGGADPGDMYVQERKYDDTQPSTVLNVPWGSYRMVECGKKNRHFLGDTHGFNLRAWKDGNAPELQASGIPLAWEKVVTPAGSIPLFRPRVLSVATP